MNKSESREEAEKPLVRSLLTMQRLEESTRSLWVSDVIKDT